jgi:ATP-dependent RNA helicase SUPV3L1/SUV3
MARGVAYQLIEALGVIERQKVAEDVKGLDQPARATLRKYGIRFGAYHIYVPGLLKPAPRVLATQLWALQHSGSDLKGLGDILRLAASGRTSIAGDKEFDKALYRLAGYRVCGERAVRVDILERLADLIRPALAWRTGAAGTKPPGAIDGFGFTVSGGMTSLAGCSGEDFASVLRSLGYRMEKRPKPVASAADSGGPTISAEGSSAEIPAGTETEQAAAVTPPPVHEGLFSAEVSPDAKLPETPPMGVSEQSTSPPDAQPPDSAQPAAQEMINVTEAPTLAAIECAERPEDDHQSPTAAKTAEPAAAELIEVWRPFRRGEQRSQVRERTARRRRSRRPVPRVVAAGTPTSAQEEVAVDAVAPQGVPHALSSPNHDAEGRRHSGRHPSERRQDPDQRRTARPRRPDRHRSDDRMEHEHHGGRPRRGDSHDRQSRGDRPERDPALRAKYIKGREQATAQRDREPDPNSPFAKLAELKERLEAEAKEPS